MLRNGDESRAPGVFFTGFWRCKKAHGVLGVLLLCGSVLLMTRLHLQLFQEDMIPASEARQAILTGLVSFILFFFGLMLLFSLITSHSIRLTLGEAEINYGPRYIPWRRVSRIEARKRRGNLQIVLSMKAGLFRRRWLIIDNGITVEQWSRIVKSVEENVQPHFPHVRIGKLPCAAAASPEENGAPPPFIVPAS